MTRNYLEIVEMFGNEPNVRKENYLIFFDS